MSYAKIVFLGLTLLLLCGGCGLNEGVVQKESRSFLWFTGNTQNAIVYVDDSSPIVLNDSSGSDSVYYETTPGIHTITVKVSGEELVNRRILLGNGITKEIKIP